MFFCLLSSLLSGAILPVSISTFVLWGSRVAGDECNVAKHVMHRSLLEKVSDGRRGALVFGSLLVRNSLNSFLEQKGWSSISFFYE